MSRWHLLTLTFCISIFLNPQITAYAFWVPTRDIWRRNPFFRCSLRLIESLHTILCKGLYVVFSSSFSFFFVVVSPSPSILSFFPICYILFYLFDPEGQLCKRWFSRWRKSHLSAALVPIIASSLKKKLMLLPILHVSQTSFPFYYSLVLYSSSISRSLWRIFRI